MRYGINETFLPSFLPFPFLPFLPPSLPPVGKVLYMKLVIFFLGAVSSWIASPLLLASHEKKTAL